MSTDLSEISKTICKVLSGQGVRRSIQARPEDYRELADQIYGALQGYIDAKTDAWAGKLLARMEELEQKVDRSR